MVDAATSRPPSVAHNFSWTLIGNGLFACFQWAMFVVLAKLCSAEMVGKFALALAITAPVFLFAGFNLRTVQATDAVSEFQFGDYMGLRLLSTTVAFAFVLAIEIVSGQSADLLLVVLMTSVAKALDSIGDVIFGLLQQREQMDRIAKSQIARGFLQLLGFSAAAYATRNVFWALTGMGAASLVVLLGYDLRNARRLLYLSRSTGNRAGYFGMANFAPLQFGTWRKIRALLRVSFPLGLVAVLGSLLVNIPRYFVEGAVGKAELAVYSAMAYSISMGGIAIGSVCQAAAARLARYYVENFRQFARLLMQLVAGSAANGAIGILVALLWGRQLLTILYRPEYAKYPAVFAWVMVAAGVSFVATALGYGLAAARKFDVQVPIYLCSVLMVVGACALLVPRYGLLGAAWALLAGFLTWCAGFSLAMTFALSTRTRMKTVSAMTASLRSPVSAGVLTNY